MRYLSGDGDTICALSTATGQGAIAIVRVSGPRAAEVVRHACSFLPVTLTSHHVYYGHFVSAKNAAAIDEVLLTYFAQGRSFTGEETIEINCHGSQVVVDTVLSELVEGGCRPADRGEFTYRAFMNQRIDLVQAESVLSLIQSRSQAAARLALRHLQGELSQVLKKAEEDLLWMLAHLEASIDFAHEDIETSGYAELRRRGLQCVEHIERLLGSYQRGRKVKEGYCISLVGPTNAGKSSLFNALLGEARAIVSATPGTTRDTVSATRTLSGIEVELIDTAGLRHSEDQVELIGMERTRAAMVKSDHILAIFDASVFHGDQLDFLADTWDRTTVVLSKADLLPAEKIAAIRRELPRQTLIASAQRGLGLEEIHEHLSGLLRTEAHAEGPTVVSARQYELMCAIAEKVRRAQQLLEREESPEFVAFELTGALKEVNKIFGKDLDEEVIDRVFKEFCLGK